MSDKDDLKLTVHKVPVSDTGIGKSQGYANDAEFIDVADAELEEVLSMLTPEARKRIEKAEADFDRCFLFGEDPTMGRNDG